MGVTNHDFWLGVSVILLATLYSATSSPHPHLTNRSRKFEVQRQVTKMSFYLAGAFGNTLNLLPVVYQ